MKIFEALSMGKAVVSTTVGAEGLPLIDNKHFLKADTPKDFAAAVLRLLMDPSMRKSLGSAGRQLVVDHYSWHQVGGEFEARCLELVSKHRC